MILDEPPDPHEWREVVADPFDPEQETAIRAADLAHNTSPIDESETWRSKVLPNLRHLFLVYPDRIWRTADIAYVEEGMVDWEIPYFMADLEREGLVEAVADGMWRAVRPREASPSRAGLWIKD